MAPCSFHPVTVKRTYGPANAPLTATAYDKASADRAKLVVDVGMGYFGGHTLKAGKGIRYHTVPCRTFLVFAGLLPPVGRPYPRSGSVREHPAAPFSFHPVTAIRKYGSASALQTATLYEKALADRVQLVVDVGMGYRMSIFSRMGKRVANVRRHGAPFFSFLVCCPALGRW